MKTNLQGLVCTLAMVILAANAVAQNLYLSPNIPNNYNIVQVNPSGKGELYSSGNTVINFTPHDMTFDRMGDLFIASYALFELTNGDQTLSTNLTLFSPFGGTGLAFDRAGDLYLTTTTNQFAATQFQTNCFIFEFTNDNGTLSTNPTVFANGLINPQKLAFDSMGNLYVSCVGTNSIRSVGYVTEITTNGSQNIICTNLTNPDALVFDAAGNLYVSEEPSPSGTEILEIATNGLLSAYQSGGPVSIYKLAFDNTGVFYVDDGNVLKFVTPESSTLFFHMSEVALANFSITAMAFEPEPLLQPSVANGEFQLTVTMPSPYFETILQASTNLFNWYNIYTNTPPFIFTDSLTKTACFYRAVLDTNSY